ncbi:unnamed protein product [Danaus chrysippus]|uniref:(African queen) hypothetical protein n=1 Tax=Danaus chrysippus TaxID=151541 RepID=A0A8J2QPA7_9NEOP|nr:unnamed protein product [Danaus chrysippus]
MAMNARGVYLRWFPPTHYLSDYSNCIRRHSQWSQYTADTAKIILWKECGQRQWVSVLGGSAPGSRARRPSSLKRHRRRGNILMAN